MVAAPESKPQTVEVVEVDVNNIKVTTRLRNTSEEQITELARSIEELGILHPITVSLKNGKYTLLSGHHRLEAYKQLGYETIPATIKEADPLIEKLVEVSENLVRSDLNAIEVADHIIMREEILEQLGQRAKSGNNRWNRKGFTNAELASSMGVNKRTYQNKKSVANLHPEVKDLLGSTEYAKNMGDMVLLAKQSDEVQLEVASILTTGQSGTFKRALQLARCKLLGFEWEDENKQLSQRVGKPTSIMKWDGGENSAFARLCKLVTLDDETRMIHRKSGGMEFQAYSQHPDHAAFFIDYYSKPGDLILDCFSGRGTNLLVGAAMGRRVVGYDLTAANLEKVRSVALEHTDIEPTAMQLHHSDGCELAEYSDQSDLFDLVTTDPPYLGCTENYSDDPRELPQKDIDAFRERMTQCLSNLKRLIKPSDWDNKDFHPVVIKCGSARKGTEGLIDMGFEVETIARQLGYVVHDKVFNILNSHYQMFTTRKCIEHRYTQKVHETNLVLLKY